MLLYINVHYFLNFISNKPKTEMTEDEMRQKEEEEFNTGPLSLLTQSVKHNTQVCHVVIV